MKAFIALILCTAAVVHAMIDHDFERRVEQFPKECLSELNLDPGLLNNNDRTIKRPSIQEQNCYTACIDKKMGIMSQDGTYDKEALVNIVMAEEGGPKSNVDEFIQNCTSQAGNDHCKMAACIHLRPPHHWK